jgi:hypothetical protein
MSAEGVADLNQKLFNILSFNALITENGLKTPCFLYEKL